MARAQQRSGMTWVHGSLIAFVFLWLVSTVLLVLLYTDQTTIKEAQAKLNRSISKLANSEETQSLEWYKLANEGGPTALGLAEKARAETARLATGSVEDKPSAVQEKSNALLDQIVVDGLVPTPEAFQEANLLSAAQQLYDAFRAERDQHDKAQAEVTRLQEETTRLAEMNEKQQVDFDGKINVLQQTIDAIRDKSEQHGKDRDSEVKRLEASILEIRQESGRQSQAYRTERTELEKQLAELQTRYSELRNQLGQLQISPQDLITARQGDGVVLTANPGEEIVYIDLGQEDHLVLGMRFAIYSAQTGIPADGEAKAQIEIVTIYDQASACRVTRQKQSTFIEPGDIVANPMYDRERTLRFVVAGDFDVNGDGQPDPAGSGHVQSLIQHWGGEILPEVSPLVDFVVVGVPPRLPYPATDATPEEDARNQVAKERLKKYEAIVDQAKALSVPILPQATLARFLGTTGPLPAQA